MGCLDEDILICCCVRMEVFGYKLEESFNTIVLYCCEHWCKILTLFELICIIFKNTCTKYWQCGITKRQGPVSWNLLSVTTDLLKASQMHWHVCACKIMSVQITPQGAKCVRYHVQISNWIQWPGNTD